MRRIANGLTDCRATLSLQTDWAAQFLAQPRYQVRVPGQRSRVEFSPNVGVFRRVVPCSDYQVLHDGGVQQRRPVVDVDVAAVLYDDLGDLGPLARVLHREVERRVRPHVGRVDAGPVVNQVADHAGVSLPCRHPQRRVLAVVHRLQVGAARH